MLTVWAANLPRICTGDWAALTSIHKVSAGQFLQIFLLKSGSKQVLLSLVGIFAYGSEHATHML